MLKKLLILFAAFVVVTLLFRNKLNPTSPNQNVVKEYAATLRLGEKKFDVSQYIGGTALVATETKVKIEKTGEKENAFITSIEGKAADPKKREFWEFLVNGKQTKVGAGSYIVQNGDQIEWKISNW